TSTTGIYISFQQRLQQSIAKFGIMKFVFSDLFQAVLDINFLYLNRFMGFQLLLAALVNLIGIKYVSDFV
ncbi:hypothetical protein ABEU79_18085, partial [Geobacillus thermodenitrificans]|uniref:hypothetical protein n=1 Tax=Geobacillus thermodenitrificans TaxID=33940 RepID=UPI003D20B77C